MSQAVKQCGTKDKVTPPQVSPVCTCANSHANTYRAAASTHIMLGQSQAGPVVCHSEAIRGEPTQVSSCQSSDERQAGLMRLYTAPGK